MKNRGKNKGEKIKTRKMILVDTEIHELYKKEADEIGMKLWRFMELVVKMYIKNK